MPPDGVGLDPRPRSPLFYVPARLPASPGRSCPPPPTPGKGWPGSAGWADRERCGEAEDPTRLPGCGAQRGRRPGSDHCGVRPQELSGLLGSLPPAGAGAPQPASNKPRSWRSSVTNGHRVPPGGCGGGDCRLRVRS